MREGGSDSWRGDYMSENWKYPKSDLEAYAPNPDLPDLSFWQFFLFMFNGEKPCKRP